MKRTVIKHAGRYEPLAELGRDLCEVARRLHEGDKKIAAADENHRRDPKPATAAIVTMQHRRQATNRRHVLGVLQRAKNIVTADRRPKKTPICPTCGTRFKTWTGLVRHGRDWHDWFGPAPPDPSRPQWAKCPCGFKPKKIGNGLAVIASHLAGQSDLAAHLRMAAVAGNGKAATS